LLPEDHLHTLKILLEPLKLAEVREKFCEGPRPIVVKPELEPLPLPFNKS